MSEAKINGGVLLAVDNFSVSFAGVLALIDLDSAVVKSRSASATTLT